MQDKATTLINGRFLAKPATGVTLVAKELTRALLSEVSALPAAERPKFIIAAPEGYAPPFPPGFSAEAHSDWLSIQRGSASIPGEQLLLPARYGALQVMNFCNAAPVLARRAIVWIHDAQIYDSADSYSPVFRTYTQAMFAALRLRRARIATVSAYSKTRLVHHGFDPDLITVILNGGDHLQGTPADEGALAANGLAPQGFALLVGSRALHKNIPFAVRALVEHGPRDLIVAVAGLHQAGAYVGEETAFDPARVRLLPRLSEGALRALMQKARFVLCPSLDEGFGLSAAEALWEETPLGLSHRASLPEVGGDAALYFDPTDARAIGDTAAQLCRDDVQSMLKSKAALQKLKLTWARAAQETLAHFV